MHSQRIRWHALGVGVRLYNTERFSKRRGAHNFSQRIMKHGSAVLVDY